MEPFGSDLFNKPLKVYLSGAITHASPELTQTLVTVKKILREAGFEVLDFVLDPNSTPEEVFIHDIGCIEQCNFVLGILDEPSTGIGAEMVWALREYNKPVLLVTKTGKISRFIEGHQSKFPAPKLQVLRYQNPSELVFVLLREYVKDIMI